MSRYPDLILKPCRGSVGIGVMRLTRSGEGRWLWSYSISGSRRKVSRVINPDAIPRALRARLSSVPYLVQERIPLAEINGRPFDLRVTVQRGWGRSVAGHRPVRQAGSARRLCIEHCQRAKP